MGESEITGHGFPVTNVLANLVLDLLLPRTDSAVRNQWIVMAIFWVAVFWLTRRLSHDYAWGRDVMLLVAGIAVMNLAWFAVRAVH